MYRYRSISLRPLRRWIRRTAPPRTLPILGAVRWFGAGIDGRVMLHQPMGEALRQPNKAKPKLCSGCGTEVLFSENTGVRYGTEALRSELSKRQAKLARFVNVGDFVGRDTWYCDRCRALKSDDIWKAYNALNDIPQELFTKQLQFIVGRRRFGLCLVVVDATDPEHSAMKHLGRCIGRTPRWLIVNKIDLVPRMEDRDIKALEIRIGNVAKTRFLRVFAVSSKTGYGVLELAEQLLANLRGKDVFCVGAANVGKTTLVQRLSSLIVENVRLKGNRYYKRREATTSFVATTSHLPGTTLQAVRIPCFPSFRQAIWDTPGIINKKAVQYSIFPAHLMEPLARPGRIPLPTLDNKRATRVNANRSILIEAPWTADIGDGHSAKDGDLKPAVLGRVDVLDDEGGDEYIPLYVKAYLHPSLNLRVVWTSEAPDHVILPKRFVDSIQKRLGETQSLPEIKDVPLLPNTTSPDNERGLVVPTKEHQSLSNGRFYMDVSFASLGWLAFSNERPFRLIPYCVKGSVYSRRRSLYPTTLDLYNEYIAETLEEGEAKNRLMQAVRDDRAAAGRPPEFAQTQSENSAHHGFDFDDDEFY